MRNIPFTMSLREAHRGTDFSKLVKYGDIWAPLNIAAGDIMRADLATHYKFSHLRTDSIGLDAQKDHDPRRDGFVNFNQHAGLFDPDSKFQPLPRNTVVLGFDLDVETYDVRYVRLARFSYNVDKSRDPLTEPQFFEDDIRHFAKPVTLEGRRINFAFFDTGEIGRMCDRTGIITSEKVIERIKDALTASEDERHYIPKCGLEGTLFVPAIDPRKWREATDFELAENDHPDYKGMNFFDLDEESQNELIEDALWVMAERVNTRRHQFFHERDLLYQAERRIKRKVRDSVRKAAIRRMGLDRFDRGVRQDIIGSVIDDIDRADKALVDKFAALEDEGEIKAEVSLASGKRASVKTLLSRAVDKYQAEAERRKRLFTYANRGELTADLRQAFENVGVGGLKREPNIEIPGDLFRWRFLMLRVPDLHDPSNFSDVSYRPCIVWDGFWSLNEQGEPELAGLELYPCTRHAEDFSWKLGIETPLRTKSKRASFLIPELLIRAPMSTEYFHPQQPTVNSFRNLNAGDRYGFEVKREIFAEHRGEPKVWGLQERPKNWLPIDDEVFFELPENAMQFARRKKPKLGGRRIVAM